MEFNFKSIIVFSVVISHLFSYSPRTYAAIPKITNPKILIQSIDADDAEFQDFIKDSKDFISLEDLRPTISNAAPEQLVSLQKLAELEFLGEDPHKALPLYERITSMGLDHDWDLESRAIIFSSFFRLAQLEINESERHIRNAILFDFDQYPNPETIPLGFQATFKNIRAELEKEMLDFNPSVSNTYYVNGVKDLKKLHPNALYRITFVSNTYGLKTEVAKGESAQDLFPYGVPLAQGDCRNLVAVNPDVKDLKSSFVFTSKSCSPKLMASVASLTQAKLKANESALSSDLPAKSIQTEVVSLNLYPSSIDTENLGLNSTPTPMSTKGKLSKKQKTWIWVASGIVAATLGAVLIQKQNDKSHNYEPTESSGF